VRALGERVAEAAVLRAWAVGGYSSAAALLAGDGWNWRRIKGVRRLELDVHRARRVSPGLELGHTAMGLYWATTANRGCSPGRRSALIINYLLCLWLQPHACIKKIYFQIYSLCRKNKYYLTELVNPYNNVCYIYIYIYIYI
jgi:hypothetical protein